jgi:hypothetical protein
LNPSSRTGDPCSSSAIATLKASGAALDAGKEEGLSGVIVVAQPLIKKANAKEEVKKRYLMLPQ